MLMNKQDVEKQSTRYTSEN